MTKRPYSVGYFSSYDRGLECLLDMWPKIKKQVPDATLDIFYGWNMYDQFHRKDAEKMKWKWQMIRKMHDVGAVEHGRVNHQQLADAMKEIQVWAYPTSFQEIFAITAIKAQAAKCQVVTSGYAALQETVMIDEENIENISSKPEKLEAFVNRVVEALRNPRDEEALERIKQEVIEQYDWSVIAQKWSEALNP